MLFSNFLNFFATFLKFSILGRVGTHRNDFLYFFSFSAIPNLFWLEMKLWLCFEIFWIFLLFFWNFLFPVCYELIRKIFFLFSLFHDLSLPILTRKEAMMVFSNFLNFSVIFLKFSIPSRVGTNRNDFFLFSLFLGHSQPILSGKEVMMVFSNFLNFFAVFYIFYSGSGRNPSERYFLFFLFLGHSQPILVWKEAMMVFYNFFFYFSAIFLEFAILGRVETLRNDFFFLILGLSHPILAWKEAMMVSSNFLNFLLWVGLANIGMIFFTFSLSRPFPTYFGLKWSDDGVLKFFEFFLLFFLEFSIPAQVETHRNVYFYFLFFSTFLILFWHEKKLWLCFQIFWIFLLFFWNFVFRVE